MGVVLARDLIDSHPDNRVTLVDIDFDRLKSAARFVQSDRLVPLQRNVEDKVQREGVFENQDVALCALLHKHSLMTLETAVGKKVHFVDLVGEFTLERMAFDQKAQKKDLTILSGVGVSPGITNVCVGRAVFLLDKTENAQIYVGGNPVEPKPPLNYRIVYAVNSLLGLYDRQVPILEKGEPKTVAPLSGLENIRFSAPFQDMECFYTDGLSSLFYTMQGKVQGFLYEKTIRHKGHAGGIEILKSCGLFSKKAVRINNQDVVPRAVLEALLDERIRLGDEQDVTLLRIKVNGKKEEKSLTHVFEMVDYYDSEKNYTSMAKTTSFPASVAAQMIVGGTITKRGVLFPEDVFYDHLYEPFMQELRKRGVEVSHEISME